MSNSDLWVLHFKIETQIKKINLTKTKSAKVGKKNVDMLHGDVVISLTYTFFHQEIRG